MDATFVAPARQQQFRQNERESISGSLEQMAVDVFNDDLSCSCQTFEILQDGVVVCIMTFYRTLIDGD